MRSRRFVILVLSCIVFVIVFLVYQTGNREQSFPDRETDREPVIERQGMENESTAHSEEIWAETAEESESTESIFYIEDAADMESVKWAEEEFYYTDLTDDIRQRITGRSYPDTEEPLQISYDDLAYVHVLHYDFASNVQEGELICNQAIAQDLIEIFRELYDNCYPIEKIRLVDAYDADDEASMADNNTSCFNYRTVPGKTKISNHSYGLAIDINPLYNPYVRTQNGETLVSPDNAALYVDRSAEFPHKIDKEDLCYKLFIQHGFRWGGAWNSGKDYQHFEKKI